MDNKNKIEEALKAVVKNCHNSTVIFDTRDYILLDDAINVLATLVESTRWRKVEEELPEEDKTLLIDSNKKTYKGKMEKLGLIRTKPILVKYQDNSVVISYRCQCKGDSYYWWECTESFEKDNPKYIISWKPIH